MISEGFRRRLFGNGPGVGEAIKVNAVPATVIGVAADGFEGLQSDGTFRHHRAIRADASGRRRPASMGRFDRATWWDVSRAACPSTRRARNCSRAGRRFSRRRCRPRCLNPSGRRCSVSGWTWHRSRRAFRLSATRYGTTLVVLLGLMGMLLAVACANLAGLTLARSLTRRHQVAIRLALGGSARRVFWQLLLDGILLSAVAFAGAVPLAWGIVRAVTASLMFGLLFRSFRTVTPDAGVLAAAALLTLLIGLAMGVVSAWQSVAVRVDECLRPRPGDASARSDASGAACSSHRSRCR